MMNFSAALDLARRKKAVAAAIKGPLNAVRSMCPCFLPPCFKCVCVSCPLLCGKPRVSKAQLRSFSSLFDYVVRVCHAGLCSSGLVQEAAIKLANIAEWTPCDRAVRIAQSIKPLIHPDLLSNKRGGGLIEDCWSAALQLCLFGFHNHCFQSTYSGSILPIVFRYFQCSQFFCPWL